MFLATAKANESRRRSHFAQSTTYGSVINSFFFLQKTTNIESQKQKMKSVQ